MRKQNNLTYDILQDVGNAYAQQLGLKHVFPEYLRDVYLGLKVDLPRVNGEPSWSLAMPARYLVNQNGVVIAADFDPDYTVRPEPHKTIDDVKSLL